MLAIGYRVAGELNVSETKFAFLLIELQDAITSSLTETVQILIIFRKCGAADRHVVKVSIGASELVLFNKLGHDPLKSGNAIGDSKGDPSEMV